MFQVKGSDCTVPSGSSERCLGSGSSPLNNLDFFVRKPISIFYQIKEDERDRIELSTLWGEGFTIAVYFMLDKFKPIKSCL